MSALKSRFESFWCIILESEPLYRYSIKLIDCYYCISSNRSWVSNTSRVSNRIQGLTANTIELIVLVHWTVVRCVIRDVLRYVGAYQYVITASESFKKAKSYSLKLKSEASKPGGSNRSRVSNTSRVSNRSRGSELLTV